MTEAEKDSIREECRQQKARDVARAHSITRAYVYLILKQPPDEEKRAWEIAHGLGAYDPNEPCPAFHSGEKLGEVIATPAWRRGKPT